MLSLQSDLIDNQAFKASLASAKQPLTVFRDAINNADEQLVRDFDQGVNITHLVHSRAKFVDQILSHAWRLSLQKNAQNITLIAVGGYGRGELHPSSDVDIMILLRDDNDEKINEQLSQFLTFLWDIGLEVGQSVRTLEECSSIAAQDITVATNLIESRFIIGDESLYDEMNEVIAPDRIWSSEAFFEAKWIEQINRHQKFDDTAYNLEPNVKEGPGGLRDIQMISWVTKRHFNTNSLHDLVAHNFLTEDEYQKLIDGQEFLWKIRFALHVTAGRREDRLLFDYQRSLASKFGFEDEKPDADESDNRERANGYRLGVELFMRRYYRTIMELRSLNEMLLQLYQEALLHKSEDTEPTPINRRFQIIRGFIETTHANTFVRYPFAMLEIFFLIQSNPTIKGIRASTIRQIRNHCHIIDENFRRDIRCRTLFMDIFRQPKGITRAIRQMSRHGVLAAYIPAFGRIVGMMQYDLFHAYTVDQHSLFVVRNLRRFTVERYADEFPLCSTLIQRISKPELLYITGLFHDIAKGRGGDHSKLGEVDARQFCHQHDFSERDTDLVAWLVRNHLLMSSIAQHKDIGDPEVINDFANIVQDSHRLEYLYLLTVADMRATNPKIWNNWKDALLIELYKQTKRAFSRGLENPLDRKERVQETQNHARIELNKLDIPLDSYKPLWDSLDSDYFLRYSMEEIVWHTRNILQHNANKLPLPLILIHQRAENGGTDLFIHTRLHNDLFASVTAALDRLGLNIVEARILPSTAGTTMDTYTVLEYDDKVITNPERIAEIQSTIENSVAASDISAPVVSCDASRVIEHFSFPPEISFTLDSPNQRTILEIITTDRPGLLSRIARVLTDAGVLLQNAKIATQGAQVEDVFFITNRDHLPIEDSETKQAIKESLLCALEPDDSEN